MSLWWKVGCLSAMTSVLLGAFGAHGLRNITTPRGLEVWNTAAKYQMYHAIGTLLAVSRAGPVVSKTPCMLFTVGTVIFSGSLYALVLTDEKRLGALTPIGGVLFALGWGALAFMV